MNDHTGERPNRVPGRLLCPLCGDALTSGQGVELAAFRCARGHVSTARALLQDHSHQTIALLQDVESTLESKVVLSADLVAHALDAGQDHLVRYLERELDDARRKLDVTRTCLRDEIDGLSG